MRTSFSLVSVIIFGLSAMTKAAEPLHHREVTQKNPGGKDLIITLTEVRREDKTSTVKVSFKSGASVASSMFVARGLYDIANLRKMAYFVKLSEWEAKDGSWMYVVGFSNDKTVDPSKFFQLDEKLPKSDKLEFMSVEEFDLIFKGKQ